MMVGLLSIVIIVVVVLRPISGAALKTTSTLTPIQLLQQCSWWHLHHFYHLTIATWRKNLIFKISKFFFED